MPIPGRALLHPSGPLRPALQMASATDARYGQKESSDQNFDYMFKILIIGNSSVGKTSFLFRYADDSFTPAFVSTVGIDFKVKTIYRNDKRIKLQIWVRGPGEKSTPAAGALTRLGVRCEQAAGESRMPRTPDPPASTSPVPGGGASHQGLIF